MKSIKLATCTVLFAISLPAPADIVHNDDVIITFSLCVGNDCVNGESFGFDTIRLKENNTRLHFDDTSTSASFPRNDWRIVANDSTNGGGSYLAIEDSTAGRQVFRVEAGARANALYVEDDGDIGIGTNTPATDIDLKTGNTPTLRLQQDGSSGFTAQTWDVAGNEAGFFIRDATSGSTLPLRIRPGAPSSAIDVFSDKIQVGSGTQKVGIGTNSPDERLDVEGTADNGEVKVKIQNLADGVNQWAFSVTDGGSAANESELRISKQGTGAPELTINQRLDGNATGDATLIVDGSVMATNVAFASSRELKTDFQALDTRDVLNRVAQLEVGTWRYKAGSPGTHIGPIAEDFEQIFELGTNGKTISVVDANGIALAAIKGLYAEMQSEVQKRDEAIEMLSGQIADLQSQLDQVSGR